MGEFETTVAAVLVPRNCTIVADWRSYGSAATVDFTLNSNAFTLNVLPAQAFVATLAATCGTRSVSSVALHANLANEHASLSFGESCHSLATNFLYLTATTGLETS